jgi:DNA-binding NarL/FixJ family response regulator
LGYGNKEIAHLLGVGESDVKKRIHRLKRVLSARSRTGLVRAAMARGLISLGKGGRDL